MACLQGKQGFETDFSFRCDQTRGCLPERGTGPAKQACPKPGWLSFGPFLTLLALLPPASDPQNGVFPGEIGRSQTRGSLLSTDSARVRELGNTAIAQRELVIWAFHIVGGAPASLGIRPALNCRVSVQLASQ
jgi:hypothetical protein